MEDNLNFLCDEIVKIVDSVGLRVSSKAINETYNSMQIYINCNANVMIYISKKIDKDLECTIDINDKPYEVPPYSIPFRYNVKEYKRGKIYRLSSSGGVYGLEGTIDRLILKMQELEV